MPKKEEMALSHFENRIKAFVENRQLLVSESRVVVALSGGADSVALLLVLKRIGYECIAVHCNFHLRGGESDRDCRFALDLCRRQGVECLVKDFDVAAYMNTHGVSMEMACRELRYQWFEEVRKQYACDAIAVAHHCNDNAETFFLNLMRGTGITGLAGMRPRNGFVVRPLLCVGRADVEAYLRERGNQPYVVDSTNRDTAYLRNRIRNVVLPMLRECFPNADDAIRATMSNLAGNRLIYEAAVQLEIRNITAVDNDGVIMVDLSQLLESPSPATLLHEILHSYGFNSIQVAELLQSAGRHSVGALFRSAGYVAEVRECHIIVYDAEKKGEAADEVYHFVLLEHTTLPLGLKMQLAGNTAEFRFENNPKTAYFDGKLLGKNLTLRHWRQGDRFRPFGMKGSKKLSDYFNDHHFSAFDKRNVWLLCDDETILWIVGHRSSEVMRVETDTEKIVVLHSK